MATQTFRIVTPEAVELDLDAAGLASRVLAILIDLLLLGAAIWAILIGAGVVADATLPDEGGRVVLAVIGILTLFLALVIWPAGWEVATKGRSPGKMALGLRVVTVEGAPIRVRHALVRSFVGMFEVLFTLGVVAVTVALGSRRFRRLGDHLAGTVVVRERGAGGQGALPRRFFPPPGWEAWTANLDATRLTADDYRLVRSYLLRSASLPPGPRARLGHQILLRVLGRSGVDPSVLSTLGTWPLDAPLTAVAAAYQHRFD